MPQIPPFLETSHDTFADRELVPRQPAFLPALQAADAGVAASLESVISENTRRVYGTQWRLFQGWCAEVGLQSLPAEPLTVARYLAHRANSGAAIATLRLAASAIGKAHEWAKHGVPLWRPGRARLFEGMGTPPRQTPTTVRRPHRRRPRRDPAHRHTTPQARPRHRDSRAGCPVGRGLTWRWWRRCPTRACGAARRTALTWGDVQRWDDGSGRITVIRSKTDMEAQGAVVAITPAAMTALDGIRPR